MPNSKPAQHYHDIDGMRSVLMFLSVALHAATVYAPARPWITSNAQRHEFFDWVIFGLHLVITPTFFFVGGIFTVLMLARRTPGRFLRNRFMRTVVPLIAIALSFNMLEHYLRWNDKTGDSGLMRWIESGGFAQIWVSGEWSLHLWFLVSLVPMFIFSAIVQAAIPKGAAIRTGALRMVGRAAGWLKSSWAFALFVLALAAANTVNFAVASQVPGGYDLLFPGFQSWYKLISEFPFFVLGVAAALSPSLLDRLRTWRAWMPFAAVLAFAFQPYANPDQGFAAGMAMLFLNQLAIWTLVLFLIQFFYRHFSNDSLRTRWLADSALSMYLFHHCLVYIYGRGFTHVEWPIALEWALLTVAAAATVILFHETMVRRFALLRLLFNGKTDVAAIRKAPGFWQSFGLPGVKRANGNVSGAGGKPAV